MNLCGFYGRQVQCNYITCDTIDTDIVGHCVIGIKMLKLVEFVPVCRRCVITPVNKILSILCLKI